MPAQTNSPLPSFNRQFSPETLKTLADWQAKILGNPVAQRLTNNWKVLIMDTSTAISITGLAIATLSGASVAAGVAILFVSCASGVGSFYMRQFAALKSLETSVINLKATQQRLEELTRHYQKENAQLTRTRQQLQETNVALQGTNRDLQNTNQELQNTNTALRATNTDLQTTNQELQETNRQFGETQRRLESTAAGYEAQLQELRQSIEATQSAHRETIEGYQSELGTLRGTIEQMRRDAETHRFQFEREIEQLQGANRTYQGENLQLSRTNAELSELVETARSYASEISERLGLQQGELNGQLERLQAFLSELERNNNEVGQRMQLVAAVQSQLTQAQVELRRATEELTSTRILYATETAKLQGFTTSFRLLHSQFQSRISELGAITEQNQGEFARHLAELASQIELLKGERLLPPSPHASPRK